MGSGGRRLFILATAVCAAAVVAVPIARTHAALSDFATRHASASAAVWAPKDDEDSRDNDAHDTDSQGSDEKNESDYQGSQTVQTTLRNPPGGTGTAGDCLAVPSGLVSSAAAPLHSWPLTLLAMYAGTKPMVIAATGAQAPPALRVDGTVTLGAYPTTLTSVVDPAHPNGATLAYTVPAALHDGKLHVLIISAFEDDPSALQACTASFYVASVGP
jgi:hypothetical protein